MKSPSTHWFYARHTLSFALFSIALCFVALIFSNASSSRATGQSPGGQQAPPAADQQSQVDEPADVAAFRQSVGGSITPLIIELKGDPAAIQRVNAGREGRAMTMEEIFASAQQIVSEQDAFRASLAQRGIRVLMRETHVPQIDGSVRHIQYRFTYLLNGFVAYVATEDVERLRALPEIAVISQPEPVEFHLDRAVDYSLGTQTNPADRRTAVYGPTQEFQPAGSAGHPETPKTTAADGFEGQNMNVAVIDSGVDWRHPMFGGIGQATALPRVSGNAASAADNQKVIYYYALSSPGDPTDDFGHGTLVASNIAGYSVDGNTPPRAGYGTGRDGTGVGPTPNDAQLFGTAPQTRILAYKVCGPAPQCLGDIPLAVEDAASPFTLVSTGNGGPTPVAKPVADIINLSLGATAGDPAAANSRAVNNAALAGTIVVASAGNSGPGLGTVGNPGAATLAIGVAASLDPGSVAGADVLATDQIPLEPCDDNPRLPGCDNGTQVAGPPPEAGASSNANSPQSGAPQGVRIFPVAGGGPLPVEQNPGEPTENTGSLSAHYVFVDRRGDPPPPVPPSVTNRIALVRLAPGTTFASNANPVALSNPAAILLITPVESATAVVVVGGIPTFTVNPTDAEILLNLLAEGDDDTVDPPNGAVSRLPLRLADTISLPAFQGVMAGFSSRGPNDHPNAGFRILKPDVTGPGVGIVGAATVEGLPDETVGLASTTGYTTANGTSFSAPITAGAVVLIRQRVRDQLLLDSTDPAQRTKRFDTVTVARALLQNNATNLRSGLGVPQADSATASINEMGAGHINVAGALTANAIMVAPARLLVDANPDQTGMQREFNPPANQPPPAGDFDAAGNLRVLLPSASFGPVPVVRLNDSIVRTQEVIIRDVTGGAGGGTYNLTVQNNRSTDAPGFELSFTASADSATPITSIEVPPNGQASFFMRAVADGTQILVDPTEFQWYVTATQGATGKTLRMPFYFRAVTALFPNSAAPVQQAPEGTEMPGTPNCPTDTNGNYTVQWTYTTPAHIGFRVQEATQSTSIFFDNADEALMPMPIGTTVVNENTLWRDSGIAGTPQMPPQWTSQINPSTGSLAYFIPEGQAQNHSLTMITALVLPPTGITLSFTTAQSIRNNIDFGFVEISTDNFNFFPLLRVTGNFTGTREIDLSAFSGQTVRLRFRFQSVTGAIGASNGWFVENIQINSDDFQTLTDPAAAARSLDITNRPVGTYLYRIAALYTNPNPLDPGTVIIGPYSNIRCVTVTGTFEGVVSRKTHGAAGVFDIRLPVVGEPGIEPRSSGSNPHRVVFAFTQPVTFSNATVTPGPGKTAEMDGPPTSSPDGTEVTVKLKNVSNAQVLRVTLLGVNDGAITRDLGVPMAVLLGDTSGDGVVNSADVTQTRRQSGQVPAPSNFRTDLSTDGVINSADVTLVRRASGSALP